MMTDSDSTCKPAQLVSIAFSSLMMTDSDSEKQMLVNYGPYSEVVCFVDDSLPTILPCICCAFSNVLPPIPSNMMKREEWGGEFVDVSKEEVVPNRNILKLSIWSVLDQVSG